MDRHFCVTVYTRDPANGTFLMVLHRKLNKWVPPGGHVDANEIPDVAAVRETFEETGIHVTLTGPQAPADDCLVGPYGIQRNVIKAGEHEHLDLIYAAKPAGPDTVLKLNERESLGIGWFSASEINHPDFATFPTVKQWVSYFTAKGQ